MEVWAAKNVDVNSISGHSKPMKAHNIFAVLRVEAPSCLRTSAMNLVAKSENYLWSLIQVSHEFHIATRHPR